MKKLTLISLLLIAIPVASFGQGLDFGIKAGLNFSNLTDASNLYNRTGFVGGIFAGAKLSEKVGIQGDLLYSEQGADFDIGEFDLDYIIVPVVLKYYPVKRFNIHLGPQFGFLINDNTTIVIDEIVQDFKVNDFDFAGVLGVGFDLPFGIRLEGRYIFGLTEVPSSTYFNNSRNQTFSLLAGISLL